MPAYFEIYDSNKKLLDKFNIYIERKPSFRAVQGY